MTKHFVDTSIFQGVRQFSAPGGEFRLQQNGLYEKQGDAFVRVLTVSSKTSMIQAYNLWCK